MCKLLVLGTLYIFLCDYVGPKVYYMIIANRCKTCFCASYDHAPRWLHHIRKRTRQLLDSDEHAQSRHSSQLALPWFKLCESQLARSYSINPWWASKPTHQSGNGRDEEIQEKQVTEKAIGFEGPRVRNPDTAWSLSFCVYVPRKGQCKEPKEVHGSGTTAAFHLSTWTNLVPESWKLLARSHRGVGSIIRAETP